MAIILPLREKDATHYATVARLIYQRKNITFYPLINADPETGYYAVSCHPLGYISLEVWSYLLQGSSQYPGLIKIISPIYVCYSLLLLWYLLSRRGYIYGILGALLLIATPSYFIQSSICGIDAFRVYMFLLAFVWLYKLIQNENLKVSGLTGFVVGMSMYSHSIGGVFTIPFFLIIYLIFSKQKYSHKILNLIIVVIVALLFGSSRYISNYFTFGSPVYDSLPVYQLEKLGHKEYKRYKKEIVTPLDRIIFGALAGFSKIKFFGLSYWIFLLSFIFSFKVIKNDKLSCIFLWVILLYYMCLILSLILDLDVFIGNYRYFLTIQPFVAYIAALFLGNLYEKVVNF